MVKGITEYEKTPTSIAHGARERVVSASRFAPAAQQSDTESDDHKVAGDTEDSVSTDGESETVEASATSEIEAPMEIDASSEVEKADE